MLKNPGYLKHIRPVLKNKKQNIHNNCCRLYVFRDVEQSGMIQNVLESGVKSYMCLLLARNEVFRGIRQPRWFLICKKTQNIENSQQKSPTIRLNSTLCVFPLNINNLMWKSYFMANEYL